MAGRQHLTAQLAGSLKQVAELHALVAAHAGNRRLAAQIGIGEIVNDRLAEGALVIQHVMRDAQPVADLAGVVDILPGAARALLLQGHAVIVELQRDADHLIALLMQQRRGDGAVHPARHGDDHAGILRPLIDPERIHGLEYNLFRVPGHRIQSHLPEPHF